MIEVLHQSGPHRLVKFPRSEESGGRYWYRSETVLGGALLGSTYDTYEEAYQDFLITTDMDETQVPRAGGETGGST